MPIINHFSLLFLLPSFTSTTSIYQLTQTLTDPNDNIFSLDLSENNSFLVVGSHNSKAYIYYNNGDTFLKKEEKNCVDKVTEVDITDDSSLLMMLC